MPDLAAGATVADWKTMAKCDRSGGLAGRWGRCGLARAGRACGLDRAAVLLSFRAGSVSDEVLVFKSPSLTLPARKDTADVFRFPRDPVTGISPPPAGLGGRSVPATSDGRGEVMDDAHAPRLDGFTPLRL